MQPSAALSYVTVTLWKVSVLRTNETIVFGPAFRRWDSEGCFVRWVEHDPSELGG